MIKRSRDILKLSKTAIYSLHRDDQKKAKEQLDKALKVAREDVLPLVEDFPRLRTMGSISGGLEEYAEARAFERFLEDGTIVTMK